MSEIRPERPECPKCRTGLIYVTSIPQHGMHRTTFVCYTCRQTRSYVLSAAMAEAYAAVGAIVPHEGPAPVQGP
jgi:hypothetical protein